MKSSEEPYFLLHIIGMFERRAAFRCEVIINPVPASPFALRLTALFLDVTLVEKLFERFIDRSERPFIDHSRL